MEDVLSNIMTKSDSIIKREIESFKSEIDSQEQEKAEVEFCNET